MGLFSDTKHTHPGIFILESPPWGNDLDENIRDIKDLDDFKKNIKAIYADC